jgi:hypothetical protein
MPYYSCQVTFEQLPEVEGRFCEAYGGALEQGVIFGDFIIEDRDGNTYYCMGNPSGEARVPYWVRGFDCEPEF